MTLWRSSDEMEIALDTAVKMAELDKETKSKPSEAGLILRGRRTPSVDGVLLLQGGSGPSLAAESLPGERKDQNGALSKRAGGKARFLLNIFLAFPDRLML